MNGKNPNCRHNIDDSMMDSIDNDFKAYFLGLIASDGYICEVELGLSLNKRDVELLEKVREQICEHLPLKISENDFITLSISSTNMVKSVINHLKIFNGENDMSFPELDNDLKWAFIRGYFDGNGHYGVRKNGNPRCSITVKSYAILNELKEFCKLPCSISGNHIEWSGLSALDFLGKIYMGAPIYMKRKYDVFVDIINWKPTKYRMNPVPHRLPIFKYSKTCNEARPPEKNRLSDTGYDLHLIRKVKEVNGVHYYDTCIKVQPDYGYYFDLVGRSSISKTGWTLANNVGIIDQSYRGSIIVALVPTIENPSSIILPCKMVQLIPRKVIIMDEPEEVIDVEETERNNTGGLGSHQF
jgi:dUTPase